MLKRYDGLIICMLNVAHGWVDILGPAIFKDPVPVSIKNCIGILKKTDLRILNFRSSRPGPPVAIGRSLFSLFTAWFPGGATIFRPYLRTNSHAGLPG